LNVGAVGTLIVTVSVNSPLENATLLHNVVELQSNGQSAPVTAFATTVLVRTPPVPPKEIIPVSTLGGVGLAMMVLLVGLLGGFRILAGAVSVNIKRRI